MHRWGSAPSPTKRDDKTVETHLQTFNQLTRVLKRPPTDQTLPVHRFTCRGGAGSGEEGFGIAGDSSDFGRSERHNYQNIPNPKGLETMIWTCNLKMEQVDP